MKRLAQHIGLRTAAAAREPLEQLLGLRIQANAGRQGRLFRIRTPEAGQALETYIAHELFCYRDYVSGAPVRHWRSASGFQVDFMLGEHTAIEIKAKTAISGHDLRSLRAIREEAGIRRCLCVALEQRRRNVDGIEIVPVTSFLKSLWDGQYSDVEA